MKYQIWVEKQSRMAHAPESGELGGSYADGAIILTSAIGAVLNGECTTFPESWAREEGAPGDCHFPFRRLAQQAHHDFR